MRWLGLWVMIGISGIVLACACGLPSEGKAEVKTIVEYEPIPTKDIEVVIVESECDEVVEVSAQHTESQIRKVIRMTMSEGSILSAEAKQAIAQVPFNRVKSDYKEFRHQTDLDMVLDHPNAFSFADNGEPTQGCYEAVETVLNYPSAFPEDMLWFNSNHYPDWGYPYMEIDGMYFSTVKNYYAEEVDYE